VREERVDVRRVDVQSHEICERHPRSGQHRVKVVDTQGKLRRNIPVVLWPPCFAHRGLPRDVQRARFTRDELSLVESHLQGPGFRTELTGLNHDEALALLTAGAAGGSQCFGLGSALASAMRKVVDALPESSQIAAADAAQRILVDPEADLLSRRRGSESIPSAIMVEVRRAVLTGHKLRIHYAADNRGPTWRTVDPIGLVTVRDKSYLLATVEDSDRTYRLSRILAADTLPALAQRPSTVDLEELWRERSARFRGGESQLTARVRVDPLRREELTTTALGILHEDLDPDGWLRLELSFQDLRHAEWALWQLGTSAEALAPASLRAVLHERAISVVTQYTERAQ
jgi:predicted DNA-binding transcriptional regulator YafY